MSFRSIWDIKSSWETWGTLVPNQRFYHEQHDFLTWHTVPWFGDSSVEHGWTVGHPCLKSHQRVQVWIQHQKFTHRSFYIKSLIKINRTSFADEQGKFLSTKKKCCRHDMLNFLVDDLFALLHSPAIHTVQWPKMQKCYVNANFLQKP